MTAADAMFAPLIADSWRDMTSSEPNVPIRDREYHPTTETGLRLHDVRQVAE